MQAKKEKKLNQNSIFKLNEMVAQKQQNHFLRCISRFFKKIGKRNR